MTVAVNATRRVARNTVILVIGQVTVQASMIIIGLLVARRFGETVYGQYTLAFAFVNIFGLLFSLGVDSILVREIARSPQQAWMILSGGLWVRLVAFPLTLALILVAALVAGYDATQRFYIFLVALFVGITSLGDLGRIVFQGLQRMELDTLSRAIDRACAVSLALVVVFLRPSLIGVILALITGAVVGAVVSWQRVPRLLGTPQFAPPRGSLRLIKAAAPIAGSMIIIALYVQLASVILSFYVSYGSVGLYNAANGVVAPFLLLPVALGTAMLPALSQNALRESRFAKRNYYLTIGTTLLLGLPVAATLILLGDFAITVLYGEAFLRAKPALILLAVQVPIVFTNTYLTNALIAHDAQRMVFIAALLNLGLTVGLSLVFIPAMDFPGAALARVAAECGGMVLMMVFMLRLVSRR